MHLWFINVVLICIFLLTNYIEHFVMGSLAVSISSLEKCLRRSLAIFYLSVVLGLHLWHMEVLRLGVELELQLPVYTTPQQPQIRVMSANYTTAHSNARSLTH